MSNIDAFANSIPPETPGVPAADDFRDGTFPTDTAQPQTQEDDPLDAEIGENGQGDLAPEDEGAPHSGDAPTDLRGGTE